MHRLRRRHRLLIAAALGSLAALGTAQITHAATWSNPAGGEWNEGSNWDTNAAPGTNDDARFDLTATYGVSLTSAATVQTVTVAAGSLTLDLIAGSLTTGTFDATGADAFSLSGGRLTVDGGVFAPKLSSIGYTTADGHVGGASNAYVVSGTPGGATAHLELTAGATATTGEGVLIGFMGGTGAVALDGAGSKLQVSNHISIGFSRTAVTGAVPAHGVVDLRNGAYMSCFQAYVGSGGGSGAVTVDGTGTTLSTSGFFRVGSGRLTTDTVDFGAGHGTVVISGGGQVRTGGDALIGLQGGIGSVTVSGSGSKLTAFRLLIGSLSTTVGSTYLASSGSLVVKDGGQASLGTVSTSIVIGDNGGNGEVLVDGGGSLLTHNVGTLYVGQVSTGNPAALMPTVGTLTLSNGGRYAGPANATLNIGFNGAKGIVNVGKPDGTDSGGTTLTARSISLSPVPTTLANSGGTLSIYAGGTVETTMGMLTAEVPDAASRINLAGGTLKTRSLSLSSASRFNWTAGTLWLTGGGVTTGIVVPTTGTFKGTGGITGNVTTAGTIAPGSSAGSLTITGDLTLSGQARLEMELGSTSDQLVITGQLIDGGGTGYTIALSDLGGTVVDQSYTLVTFASASGIAASDFTWTNAASPWLMGDLAMDGTSLTFHVTAVPEPTTLGLLTLGGLALRRRRRR